MSTDGVGSKLMLQLVAALFMTSWAGVYVAYLGNLSIYRLRLDTTTLSGAMV